MRFPAASSGSERRQVSLGRRYDLIVGVRYLHRHRVLHRDLKLGNLFLDAEMKLKIGDFGCAATEISKSVDKDSGKAEKSFLSNTVGSDTALYHLAAPSGCAQRNTDAWDQLLLV